MSESEREQLTIEARQDADRDWATFTELDKQFISYPELLEYHLVERQRFFAPVIFPEPEKFVFDGDTIPF
jgi:hypothetical protein